MTSIAVRSASPDEKSAVSAVVALAFGSDPMARWSLGDARTYLAVMPEMIRAFGDAAYDHGSAYVGDDLGGAALWLPPGVEPDVEVVITPQDWVAGRDPQLDRAVDMALAALAERPAVTPPDLATRPTRRRPQLPPRP